MIRSRICLRRLVTEDSQQWIAMRGHYKAGFLAVAGGTLDQPNAYLEAMALIDSVVAQNDGR